MISDRRGSIPTTTFRLSGIDSAVEILVDRNGIPHIYSERADDLFFAQGFNAARDRLFQLDLWRRRGLGLLSEAFGPSFVARDQVARLFLYRGDAEEDFLRYGPHARSWITAFVAGINAFVDETERDPTLLPFEFARLDYRPGRFAPEDLIRIRSSMGASNVADEVGRAHTMAEFGEDVENLRRTREPWRPVTVPEGLDPAAIPDDVLSLFNLLQAPVRIAGVADTAAAPPPAGAQVDGSNNWAVAASRTATGRPVLASDPHRAVTLPSLRYLAHLVGPGIDVIGGGEPALPGIQVGHNGKVAFGFTIFAADQEDLYCYETDPEDPRRYRYLDGWEQMRVLTERVDVRGSDPVEVELVFTRHGPVVYEDPDRHTAFAVRSAGLEPGGAPYLGSLSELQASDVFESLAALDRWAMPGENFVCADVKGNIAWKPGALVPRRPNWDGLLPVPGDGRYEWDGFYARDEYPQRVNPEEGFIVTANANEIPADYPVDRKLGYEWSGPFRRDRIKEVIATSGPMSIADHAALQVDHVSLPAKEVVRLVRTLPPSGAPDLEDALALLRGFDGNLEGDPAAALYEVWYRSHLRQALMRRALRRHLDTDGAERALRSTLRSAAVVFGKTTLIDTRLMAEARESLERGDPELAREILATLRDAVADLRERLGPDPATWSWRTLHSAALVHPLSAIVSDEERKRLDLGPIPRSGDGDTPGCTTSGVDHRQFHGADFRVVVDVGNWDASLAMNSPGQSADPLSAHYRDLFERWGADQTIPLPYSREAVETAATARLLLQPVRMTDE